MGIVSAQAVTDELLAPLMAPLQGIRGVGPTLAKRLERAVGGTRLLDLLLHLPERYVLRKTIADLAEAPVDAEVILEAEIESLRSQRSRAGRPYVEIKAMAGDRRLVVRMMNARLNWMEERAPPGRFRWFAGLVRNESFDSFSMINPLISPSQPPALEPVWPLTDGLMNIQMARALAGAIPALPPMPEWADAALVRREGWASFVDALKAVQQPLAPPPAGMRERLAYDEFLAGQLALGLVRRRVRERPGRALVGNGVLQAKALAVFGHEPTPSQRQAVAEIEADMAAPRRMLRLLQGDVGAGKTLVAALAMLRAVEAGTQAAIMAPTEILARQHLATLTRLAAPMGMPVALLAGSVKGAARKKVLRGLANGEIPIVVGTHALFQEAVEFRDLGLAVVDEQHRFGVAQRLMLAGKGEAVDMLVMTATPIPRTLLLTQWGEMAVSRLTGKPAGRLPIVTTLHGLSKLDAVFAGIARKLAEGARIYWVCPHVAESEESDIAAAETRYLTLKEHFGQAVGLAHGKMPVETRQEALASFKAGQTQILVATTVIEVGVDVPEATVMIIEHAERFGLAQLHQLRGRVGRGSAASFCMLLYDENLTENSRERLQVLRDTEDGFVIADADFRLRGAGDFLGTRQSGAPGFKIADPSLHEGLLRMANQDANILLDRDPELTSPRGEAARLLLRLFDKEVAMGTLEAG
ncbi:ATP-dependent DNA helicase RecG [Acetobacteraceae bacterium H6797]|nr:ATP-dependent DNA helicase RecG [Acetobacteraceae bacterium H6797]